MSLNLKHFNLKNLIQEENLKFSKQKENKKVKKIWGQIIKKGEKEMSKELLKPKLDVVFQALFENNKNNITEGLITDILGKKVKIIETNADYKLKKRYPEEKVGRLDLRTRLEDGTICQIEMQLVDLKNTIKRILYYWSRSYAEQINVGEDYRELKKTIGIIIADYEIEELKGIEKVESEWKIIYTNDGKRVLTEDLEIHIIEIPKARRIIEKEKRNRIAQWMMFLDNPNEKGVKEIMEENKEIKEATIVLNEMSEDEELRRLAFLKERAIRDENAMRRYEKEEKDKLEEKKREVEQKVQEVEQKEQEVESMQQEVKYKEKKLKDKEQKVKDREKDVKDKEQKVKNKEQKVEEMQKEIKETQEKIKEKQMEMKAKQKEIKEQEEKIKAEHEKIKQEESNQKKQIAKRMLERGINIEEIAEITGMTKEEILE